MSALRTLAVLSLISGAALAAAGGCSTDAIGVEDCRDIEYARCEAGHACGVVHDADDCKRFYRDQCLHGLALDDTPSATAVQNCVRSLKAISNCGPDAPLADCPGVTAQPTSLGLACDVVGAPEEIQECRFLVPVAPPVVPVPDAGGGTDAATDATID
ncbi:MAG TPA: hypothetical protein VI072_04670 [Polyangiaceae bacterium]